MEALLHYGPTILLFIVVLAVLVLVHEVGHFVAARFFGIDVEEFGIGFPPRAFGVKKGGTLYSVNWIPLGGFVKIKGEDDPSKTGPGTFSHKPAWMRTIVIVAGVFMNLVLSSILFAICFMVGLPQLAENLPPDARVRSRDVQIVQVLAGSPAEKAGLQAGDAIISVGSVVTEPSVQPAEGAPNAVANVQSLVNASGGEEIDLRVRRGKETIDTTVAPIKDDASGRYVMGIALAETAVATFPWYAAISRGISATGFYVKEIVLSVAGLIKGLFVGQQPGVEFSGPVGIAVLTGRAARLGFIYLLQFAAVLSVNLAVVNILPIPALDGGRLLFIIIEKFRGRGVRPAVEATIHRIAFFLLLGLIVLVTAHDIGRYGEQILNALKSLIGIA